MAFLNLGFAKGVSIRFFFKTKQKKKRKESEETEENEKEKKNKENKKKEKQEENGKKKRKKRKRHRSSDPLSEIMIKVRRFPMEPFLETLWGPLAPIWRIPGLISKKASNGKHLIKVHFWGFRVSGLRSGSGPLQHKGAPTEERKT